MFQNPVTFLLWLDQIDKFTASKFRYEIEAKRMKVLPCDDADPKRAALRLLVDRYLWDTMVEGLSLETCKAQVCSDINWVLALPADAFEHA